MMVVTFELWPHGDKSRRRLLGSCVIANDGTGTVEEGNYIASFQHAGRMAGKPGNWKAGRVFGFRRSLSPYHLLAAAMRAAGIVSPLCRTERLDPNTPRPAAPPAPTSEPAAPTPATVSDRPVGAPADWLDPGANAGQAW